MYIVFEDTDSLPSVPVCVNCFSFPLYLPSEKRPSLGSSFLPFQIPSQRDLGLRLRTHADRKDKDSKENLDNGATCGEEKRRCQASNGDMDIP